LPPSIGGFFIERIPFILHEYEPLFYLREEEIDGIKPWCWQISDTQAWDGPKHNWLTSHRNAIAKYVKKFDCVVQAGGNHGMYPRLLADKFNVVYTFEPDPWNYFALVNNCQKDNIIKLQAALGEDNKMVSVRRSDMCNTGMHKVADQEDSVIPMFILDSFQLKCLDFLWLDVEGYEDKVLKGAAKSIEQHHPVIFCEHGHKDIDKFLAQYGYENIGASEMDTIYIIPK